MKQNRLGHVVGVIKKINVKNGFPENIFLFQFTSAIVMLGAISLAMDAGRCYQCTDQMARSVLALCINYSLFTVIMFLSSAWFLWGIVKVYRINYYFFKQ